MAQAGLAREYMNEGGLPNSDMEKCVEHINKALELDSSHCAGILLDSAWHYRRAKQFDKAQEALNRYVHLEPAPPSSLRAIALRELARLKKTWGEAQEAELLMKEADKLDPTNWPSFRWLPPEDLYIAP